MQTPSVRIFESVCSRLENFSLDVIAQNSTIFLAFDDPGYVTQNQMVLQGLTPEGFIWAFTHFSAHNWHPMTWLSHMLDISFFGVEQPGGHHVTSLILHWCNTLLVLFAFRKLTGSFWPSALLAGLFAVHPLHVESVAWVAERKDVLSGFFGLLALWSYAFYARKPGIFRYLLVSLALLLGLLSKPMLVSWPFVLMLLDVWPLARWGIFGGEKNATRDDGNVSKTIRWRLIILEKLPWLLLVIFCCWMTILAQKNAILTLTERPFEYRLVNAILAYVAYLREMVLPVGLVAMNEFPNAFPLWQIVISLATLGLITIISLWQIRRRPWLLVGWLFYLGTLVPVIGLLQVGEQAHADRYTYLPLLGIFVMLIWSSLDFLRWVESTYSPGKTAYFKTGLATIACCVLLLLAILSQRQASHWRNELSLWSYVHAVQENNVTALINLGSYHANHHEWKTAEQEFQRALELDPQRKMARSNLCDVYMAQGNFAAALEQYQQAVRLFPDSALAHFNLGAALLITGKPAESLPWFEKAIELNPQNAEFYFSMGSALAKLNQHDKALDAFTKSIALNSNHAQARLGKSSSLLALGKPEQAIAELETAIQENPDWALGEFQMGITLLKLGRTQEAVTHLSKAVELNPEMLPARRALREALQILANSPKK